MKRVLSIFTVLALVLSLCACAKKKPAWQEQYDLGLRYLSEGNYAEAILAFNAAHNIDPDHALVYVGWGDAYVLSGATEENLTAAWLNYHHAVSLDSLLVEAYLGLANICLILGDIQRAMDILSQGVEATGSADLTARLGELQPKTSGSGWSYDTNTQTLTISGDIGEDEIKRVTDKGMLEPLYPWTDYRKEIKSAIIEDGVTNIREDTFDGCSGLTGITIPSSVTSIGSMAFSGCSGLTSITIPGSVTSLGDFAFSGCNSLTSVTISDSVTSIGESAFYYCTSLTSVAIPNNVTSIRENTFSRCSRLTSITIPDSVTSIKNGAFGGCSSLANVTVPRSVISIEGNAFSGCTSLTSITIPDSVTTIGAAAFSYCRSLTDIYYTGAEEQWAAIAINGNSNDPLLNAEIHYNSTG